MFKIKSSARRLYCEEVSKVRKARHKQKIHAFYKEDLRAMGSDLLARQKKSEAQH